MLLFTQSDKYNSRWEFVVLFYLIKYLLRPVSGLIKRFSRHLFYGSTLLEITLFHSVTCRLDCIRILLLYNNKTYSLGFMLK